MKYKQNNILLCLFIRKKAKLEMNLNHNELWLKKSKKSLFPLQRIFISLCTKCFIFIFSKFSRILPFCYQNLLELICIFIVGILLFNVRSFISYNILSLFLKSFFIIRNTALSLSLERKMKRLIYLTLGIWGWLSGSFQMVYLIK